MTRDAATADRRKNNPVVTIVIDWRTEMLCNTCVARQDWSGWNFDPVRNIYAHR